MNKHPLLCGRRAGSALVVVLCFIFLLSGLVVAVLIGTQLDRNNTQSYYQTARAQELANGATEELLSDLRDEIAAGSREDDSTTGASFTVGGKRIFVPQTALSSQPARIGFIPGTNGDYATDVDANNDKIPPTLVRVSRAAATVNMDSVYPPNSYTAAKRPVQRVSTVSTASRSANGRTVSPKRWSSTYLLSSTPNTVPARFTANPPQWVYYSRDDTRVNPSDTHLSKQVYTDADVPSLIAASKDFSSQDSILGRYAYVIYDEGGLLDINSAGYPSDLATTDTTNGPGAIRGKSSEAYAALLALTPLTGKSSEIRELINWRSKGSITVAGGFFVKAADNLLKTGFLTSAKDDSPLLSRRDLINYFTKKTNIPAALPYLGTFTRYLSAPSMRPTTPTGSSIDYEKLSETTEADPTKAVVANRDLANVRFPKAGTVDHYADDATKKSYKVKEGDQLLQSRFSLAKLDWLQDGNPNTGGGPTVARASAIQACFGLVWDFPGGNATTTDANGGCKCWNYVGARGNLTNLPGTIKTLAEVAAEGREPDFFELLKAAILSGSLGKYPGPAAFENATVTTYQVSPYIGLTYKDAFYYPNFTKDWQKFGVMGMYAHSFPNERDASKNTTLPAHPVPAQVPDMQIMRIGANIIDQYDADSWPTAIYFKYKGIDGGGSNYDPAGGSSNPIFGPVTMAYGTENLPYIQGLRSIIAYPDQSAQQIGGWRQPTLWNPHQPPAQPLPNPSLRPTNYEIRAYGSGRTFWQRSVSHADPFTPPQDVFHPMYSSGESQAVDYFTSPGLDTTESKSRGTLQFTMTATAKAFYGQNSPLVQDGLDGVSATSPYPGNRGSSQMVHYDEATVYGRPNHFVAFSTGLTDPLESPASEKNKIPYSPIFAGAGLSGETRGAGLIAVTTYILGWIDTTPNKGFHPYSYLPGVFATSTFKINTDYQFGSSWPYGDDCDAWLTPDPRTDRFSYGRTINGDSKTTMSVYKGNNGGYDVFHPDGGSVLAWNDPYNPHKPNLLGFYGQGYNSGPPAQPSSPDWNYDYPSGDWLVNTPDDQQGANFNSGGNHQNAYYTDPDGVIRPGDGVYGNRDTGDGLMTFYSVGNPTNASTASSTDRGVGSDIAHGRRPIILDRPFRSVGELGYAFRDLPFKTLDFFTDKSADVALLDVFCLHDLATVASDKLVPLGAGRVNLNAASAPVIRALLQDGAKKEMDSVYDSNVSGTTYAKGYNLAKEADSIATTLTGTILPASSYTPIGGYGQLIPTLVTAVRGIPTSNSTDKGNKAYLEAPLRALAESTDFRTWNLMIDLIVQGGQISPTGKTLGDFTVQSECHVWLHVAIDRYTGEVIARQLEPVYE